MTTLTVTPDTLAAVARKPAVVAAFPFLRPLTARRSGGRCGGCGGGAAVAPGWRSVADALFALSAARRAEFKVAAGVDRVVWRVVRGGRQTTRTF